MGILDWVDENSRIPDHPEKKKVISSKKNSFSGITKVYPFEYTVDIE